MWTSVVVFALLTGGAHGFGDTVHHSCEKNQVVSRIESSLGPNDHERQWTIECKALYTKDCSWSGFQDIHEQDAHFSCPANQVLAGFFSEFVMEQGVRRWNIYCCSAPELITTDCQKTPMVNYWNEDFDWHVPADNFLTGMHAKNNKTDRRDQRWSFSYCRVTTGDPESESVTSKIFHINEPIKKHFTHGDVVVKKGRNAINCVSCKWPKTKKFVKVPYTLSRAFSSFEKKTIFRAMNTFKQSTCIRFIRRRNHADYIKIQKLSGCWSYVGRTSGTQQLSLGNGCVYNGIIQHELSHALGFWHEQSRSDRDIYVRINYENIIEDFVNNFDKVITNNLKVPYDYTSVMHYGAKDFSKNGEDTITPLMSAVIGQRDGMSEKDILKINKFYDCSSYIHKNGNWDNKFHGTMYRKCPSGQVVSSIVSSYSKVKNDRLWGISCQAFKPINQCSWSNYVNDYQGEVDFKCADNELITGVKSIYSKNMMDRRWKFYCCSFSDFTTPNATYTPMVNYWREYFSWSVPCSNFLTGMAGVFDSTTKDRRWSFAYSQQQIE